MDEWIERQKNVRRIAKEWILISLKDREREKEKEKEENGKNERERYDQKTTGTFIYVSSKAVMYIYTY